MPDRRPVTAARIERALDGLAAMMIADGDEGRVYLPIFLRLERELEARRDEIDAMARVSARARK